MAKSNSLITLNIGDVYFNTNDGLTYRILMSDSIYLYAEILINEEWSITKKLTKEVTFYGTGVEAFLAHEPLFIRNEPLNQKEIDVLRPDLPLSIGRNKDINWGDIARMTEGEFRRVYENRFDSKILANSIIIFPLTRKGSRPKSVELFPNLKGLFLSWELLWQAAKIQSKSFKNLSGGIGLFRFGIKNQIPTYAIDNYYFSESDIYINQEIEFNWKEYFDKVKLMKPKFMVKAEDVNGRYLIIFDNSVHFGQETFAIKSASTEMLISSFVIKDKLTSINLLGQPSGIYYLGFLEGDKFRAHASIGFSSI